MELYPVNKYEGKKIAEISWPFYRYSILIPKQIKIDLFVWLFLSLYINQNKAKKIELKNYSIIVEDEVKNMIFNRFSEIITSDIMDLIVEKVKKDFITTLTDTRGNKSFIFKESTFSFIKTYEDLFSSSLQVKYMYQDGLTGDIMPFFSEEEFNVEESNNVQFSVNIKRNPDTSKIKRAYKKYSKIQKFNREIGSNRDNIDLILFEKDTDDETFLDDEDTSLFDVELKEKILDQDISVQFLEGHKALFNYKVDLYVEDNQLVVKSPFELYIDSWLNMKLLQAQNIHNKFKAFLDDLKNKYLVLENEVIIDGHSKVIMEKENQFKFTIKLFKLIKTIGLDNLLPVLRKIEYYFSSNDYEPYWSNVGKYLEALFRKFPLKTNKDKYFDYYSTMITSYGKSASVDITKLINKEIHSSWQKGYANTKVCLAEAIINHNLLSQEGVYHDFVNDIIKLYNERNKTQHYNNEKQEKPSQAQLDKLYDITMVVKNLY